MGDTVVSIIIPVKDQPEFLNECLASIIPNKTNIEVLVVDDHSTAVNHVLMWTACEKWKHFMNVRFIPSELPGLERSCLPPIKEGLRKAYGKYIKIIGADDYLEPYSIDYEMGLIGDHDALITAYVKTDEKLQPLTPPMQYTWYPLGNITKDEMKLGCYIPDYMLTKAEFFDDITYLEDIGSRWLWYVWMQMIYNGIKIKTDRKITLRYRQHGDNISKDKDFAKDNHKMPKLFAELEEMHAIISNKRYNGKAR